MVNTKGKKKKKVSSESCTNQIVTAKNKKMLRQQTQTAMVKWVLCALATRSNMAISLLAPMRAGLDMASVAQGTVL